MPKNALSSRRLPSSFDSDEVKVTAVSDIRVAPSQPSYAAAVVARTRDGSALEPLDIVIHRKERGWRLIASGTSQPGCDVAPWSALWELGTHCASLGSSRSSSDSPSVRVPSVPSTSSIAPPAKPAPATPHQSAPATSPTATIVRVIQSELEACKAHSCRVSNIRLSSHDPTYGVASVAAQGVGDAVAVVHRIGSAWTIVDVGSSEVGCGVAPRTILSDLDLSCP